MREKPDRHEIVKVKCSLCGKPIERERHQEETRKKRKQQATCSSKCAGRLGGIKSGVISRERKKLHS